MGEVARVEGRFFLGVGGGDVHGTAREGVRNGDEEREVVPGQGWGEELRGEVPGTDVYLEGAEDVLRGGGVAGCEEIVEEAFLVGGGGMGGEEGLEIGFAGGGHEGWGRGEGRGVGAPGEGAGAGGLIKGHGGLDDGRVAEGVGGGDVVVDFEAEVGDLVVLQVFADVGVGH